MIDDLSRYVFLCQTCDRLKEGFAAGMQGCTAMDPRVGPCAGPLGRMDFPKYQGPLHGLKDKFCYVCGAQSIAGLVVKVDGERRLIGICKAHLEEAKSMGPAGERPRFLTGEKLKVIE
jgi:hypothetical protein